MLYKKITTIGSIGLLLLATALVFAKENGNNAIPNPSLVQKRALTEKAETLQQVQARIRQNATQLEEVRNEAQEKVKNIKERVQEKLSGIADQAKEATAKRIANQFDRLNQTWTNHFVKVLDHLDLVLQKIQTRTDKVAANEADVTAVTTAIQSAKTTLANARTAVIDQAKKAYALSDTAIDAGVVSPTTAAGQDRIMQNLRNQFSDIKEQLQGDLFKLRDGVIKDARTAVQKALQELATIPGVDRENNNQNNGETTPPTN